MYLILQQPSAHTERTYTVRANIDITPVAHGSAQKQLVSVYEDHCTISRQTRQD